MLEDGLGKQALPTTQVKDRAGLIKAGDEVHDNLHLAFTFRDKVTAVVNKCLGNLLIPTILEHGGFGLHCLLLSNIDGAFHIVSYPQNSSC